MAEQWYLEKAGKKIEDWADKYGQVWVICGPVFFGKSPAVWLGQDGEVKAAVPDALYKIVIREETPNPEALAFLIPNVLPKTEKDYWEFLTTIEKVEALTGLKFLTSLSDADQEVVKGVEGVKVDWE